MKWNMIWCVWELTGKKCIIIILIIIRLTFYLALFEGVCVPCSSLYKEEILGQSEMK